MEDDENVGTAFEVGCTACTIFIANNKIYCANAGDSRAVMSLKDGKTVPLSEDHKPEAEKEKERIYAAGGSVKHGRTHSAPHVFGLGALAVSRALGDLGFKQDEEIDAG